MAQGPAPPAGSTPARRPRSARQREHQCRRCGASRRAWPRASLHADGVQEHRALPLWQAASQLVSCHLHSRVHVSHTKFHPHVAAGWLPAACAERSAVQLPAGVRMPGRGACRHRCTSASADSCACSSCVQAIQRLSQLTSACSDTQAGTRWEAHLLDLGGQALANLQASVRHQDAAIKVDAHCRQHRRGRAVEPAASRCSAAACEQGLKQQEPGRSAQVSLGG